MTSDISIPTTVNGLATDREPWARQPRETDKAYAAYILYREMQPPRSIETLAAQLQRKSSRHLYQWSAKHHWLERTRAYDVFLDGASLADKRDRIQEMNARHATIARAMSNKVAQRLQNLQVSELSPGEIGRWMQVIAMVERLALGEVTERRDAPDVQVNVLQTEQNVTHIDTPLDATYIAEVMDRLAARGIVPAPGGPHVIDVAAQGGPPHPSGDIAGAPAPALPHARGMDGPGGSGNIGLGREPEGVQDDPHHLHDSEGPVEGGGREGEAAQRFTGGVDADVPGRGGQRDTGHDAGTHPDDDTEGAEAPRVRPSERRRHRRRGS